jgi:acyl-coenzyme A synthetase/AMP-(fatty) acid ligase
MGKACLNYDIRVVNSRAEEVPDGVDGEMVIKGPGVMQGYFNLPSETEAVLRQDWYHTGDIVRKDEDGFLFFLGRQSGMMKVGGMRVYPLEIVEAMTAHSMVEEVAIVSERDPMRGERPKAFVVLTEGSALSESELRGFLRSRLPDYKIPRKIDFLKELPKTAGGKIIKGELEKKSQSLTEDELEEEFEILAAIDRKLVELLNERAEATLKLIESIEPKKHSVFYPDYEERLLRLALEENKGPIFDESLEDIFEKIRSVIRML